MIGENYKLSTECIIAYWKQYPDLDGCGYGEPDGGFAVYDGDYQYIAPIDETDETFMDRLKRSKDAGRNLFFEEWKRVEVEYKKGAVY